MKYLMNKYTQVTLMISGYGILWYLYGFSYATYTLFIVAIVTPLCLLGLIVASAYAVFVLKDAQGVQV